MRRSPHPGRSRRVARAAACAAAVAAAVALLAPAADRRIDAARPDRSRDAASWNSAPFASASWNS
jgi:hypothetical protein